MKKQILTIFLGCTFFLFPNIILNRLSHSIRVDQLNEIITKKNGIVIC